MQKLASATRLAVIAMAVSALACGADTTRPVPSIAGTWTLVSMNGAPLPVTLQNASPKLDLTAEDLIVGANGTFQQQRIVRSVDAGETRELYGATAGTYESYYALHVFHFPGVGITTTADITGDTMTVTSPGNSFTYQINGSAVYAGLASITMVYVKR